MKLKFFGTHFILSILFQLVSPSAEKIFWNGVEKIVKVSQYEKITLECQLPLTSIIQGEQLTFSWVRKINDGPWTTISTDWHIFGQSKYKVASELNEGTYHLQILNVSYMNDNGHYDCLIDQIKNGKIKLIYTLKFRLVVLLPPTHLQIFPMQPRVTQDREIVLTCTTRGGNPAPFVTWFYQDHGFIKIDPINVTLQRGNESNYLTSSVMTLTPDKSFHNKLFTCIVTSEALRGNDVLRKSVRLQVNYYPLVSVGPLSLVKVKVGNDVMICCHVDANPPVKLVEWTKNGLHFTNHSNFTLHIFNVSKKDEGRYTCIADNYLGRLGESSLTLLVIYKNDLITFEKVENGLASVHTKRVHPLLEFIILIFLFIFDPS